MKVDFTKFPLFTGIDRQDMVIADIRKDIAFFYLAAYSCRILFFRAFFRGAVSAGVGPSEK